VEFEGIIARIEMIKAMGEKCNSRRRVTFFV